MLKQELCFHQQTPHERSLGFSAIFMPETRNPIDDSGHTLVWMATTRCNKKDKAFNKKFARNYLR